MLNPRKTLNLSAETYVPSALTAETLVPEIFEKPCAVIKASRIDLSDNGHKPVSSAVKSWLPFYLPLRHSLLPATSVTLTDEQIADAEVTATLLRGKSSGKTAGKLGQDSHDLVQYQYKMRHK